MCTKAMGECSAAMIVEVKKSLSAGSLGYGTRVAYWAGQLAEGLKNTTFALFLLFYYNQVLGVSGTLCGLALFIAIAIDAVTDPLMGSISDGWRSRWGRRHPFMYAAAVPMALAFFAVFNPPDLNEFGLFLWLLIFSVTTRVAMTLYSVPHMALGAEMTSDYNERTTVVAGRAIFSLVGTLVVYGLGFGVFFVASEAYANGQLNPVGYPMFAAVLAVLMVLSIVGSAWGTQHLIPTLSKPANTGSVGLGPMVKDVLDAFGNLSFRWLVLGFVIVSAPVGIGTSLALYLNTFFWDITPEQMSYVLAAGPIGTLIGFVLAPVVGRYIEKKQALIWGAIGWAIFAIAPVCLYYLGLFPAPRTTGVVVGLAFCGFMAGLVVSQLVVAVGSMLADIADEHDLQTGKRQEGVFYGAYAFVIKATAGIGAAVSGLALDLIHWPTGEHIRTSADIPSDVLFKLAMIGGPALALGFIPAIWCFNHYTLDRRRHAAIRGEIDERDAMRIMTKL